MSSLDDGLRARAARIRLLALDVDGVLTDGRLVYGKDGEALKSFHVRDGLGLRMVMALGLEVAVITARRSEPVAARLHDLRIRHYLPGRDDKLAAFESLLEGLSIAPDAALFMGDDVLDLPAMRHAGLAVSVSDGHPLVRAEAHWVTAARGGEGAVREVTDGLLESRLGLARATEEFLIARERRQSLEKV